MWSINVYLLLLNGTTITIEFLWWGGMGGKMLFFTDCAVSMKLPCFIFEHLKPCKCETNYENKCSTIFSDYSTCVLYICTGTNTTTQYSGVLLQILEYRIRSY